MPLDTATDSTNDGWSPEYITYCSNVHAGENLDEVLHNLRQFQNPVRQQRGLDNMTTGLWLSASAAEALRNPQQLERLQNTLHSSGLSLTSINGFPYGNFHARELKEKVYLPDWSDRARLDYTKNLADVLVQCLPDEVDTGAISTLPLGYRPTWHDNNQAAADDNIKKMLQHLAELHQTSGKKVLLCLEMEPDCVLESTTELLHYFQQHVHPDMAHAEYLGICFDVCHQAVMFEDIEPALSQIISAGIPIGKIQLSNALQADLDTPVRQQTLRYLHEFSEPRYLHQVKTFDEDKQLQSSPDLTQALSDTNSDKALATISPWRIHFHVPLHADSLLHASLSTTRQALHETFNFLQQHRNIRPYLEVETYSWQALPEIIRPMNDAQLIDAIVSELDWVESELRRRNLLDTSAHKTAEGG